MDCRVCRASGDSWLRMGGGVGQMGVGGFSHESDHDLGAMVSDFLENGSGKPDSRYSSDSDSGLCDLVHLADTVSYYKLSVDQYESDLLSVVNSLMRSINDTDLHLVMSGPCNASCIRFSLVKLLRLSGYDAAVCSSKWQGSEKVPGGLQVYISNYRTKTQFLPTSSMAFSSSSFVTKLLRLRNYADSGLRSCFEKNPLN